MLQLAGQQRVRAHGGSRREPAVGRCLSDLDDEGAEGVSIGTELRLRFPGVDDGTILGAASLVRPFVPGWFRAEQSLISATDSTLLHRCPFR